MKQRNFLISTIAQDAFSAAETFGLGLELAEFCTALNLDVNFAATDSAIKEKGAGRPLGVLHGPFNELFPCAIDLKVRELARLRYRQAISCAQGYGISKVVLHAGFNPYLYYPCWFSDESKLFWKEFLEEIPDGMVVCLENVLEKEPELLADLVGSIGSPKLRLCIDFGHVNAYSPVPLSRWLEVCAPYISHFHIHNNDGSSDAHEALFRGTLPMAELLTRAEVLCPQASFTLELLEASPSLRWLQEQGLL